jgi:hypothetical protein
MSDATPSSQRELVVLVTRGTDHELSSVTLPGVTVQGASAMHERLKAGAASLSF